MNHRFRPDIPHSALFPLVFQDVDWPGLRLARVLHAELSAAASMFSSPGLPSLLRQREDGQFVIVAISDWAGCPVTERRETFAEIVPNAEALRQWATLGIAEMFPAQCRQIAEVDLIEQLVNRPIIQFQLRREQLQAQALSSEVHSNDESQVLMNLRRYEVERELVTLARRTGSDIYNNLADIAELSMPSLVTTDYAQHCLAQSRLLALLMMHAGEPCAVPSTAGVLLDQLPSCLYLHGLIFDESHLTDIEIDVPHCSSALQSVIAAAVRDVRSAAQQITTTVKAAAASTCH